MLRRTFLGLPYGLSATIKVEELEITDTIVLDSAVDGLSWYDFPEHDSYDAICWNVGSILDNNGD